MLVLLLGITSPNRKESSLVNAIKAVNHVHTRMREIRGPRDGIAPNYPLLAKRTHPPRILRMRVNYVRWFFQPPKMNNIRSRLPVN